MISWESSRICRDDYEVSPVMLFLPRNNIGTLTWSVSEWTANYENRETMDAIYSTENDSRYKHCFGQLGSSGNYDVQGIYGGKILNAQREKLTLICITYSKQNICVICILWRMRYYWEKANPYYYNLLLWLQYYHNILARA